MRYGLVAGFVLMGVFGVPPTVAGAQAGVCGKFVFEGCGSGHKVLAEVPAIIQGTHSECKVCSGQDPIDCHGECAATEDFSSLSQAAYQSLLAVANSGDLRAVLSLSRVVNGAVFYNHQRNAIQILDCTRSGVIASLNVDDKAIQEVAAVSLPAASSLRVAEARWYRSPRSLRVTEDDR